MKKILTALRFALALLMAGPSGAFAAARFAVCTVTCTWDGSSTAMWSATTGGATGASVPAAADTVTFDANTCVGGVTCTTTVNTNFSITSLTTGACTALTTGCVIDFSANNNSPTVQTASITGSGTRSLNCGTGTWTFTTTAAGNFWNAATTTGLTFTCSSATFSLTGSTTVLRGFSGGGLSYGTLNLGTNATRGPVSMTGSNTYAALGIAAGTQVYFANSPTITAAATWTGTSSLPIGIVGENGGVGTAVTMTMGAASTCSWCAITGVILAGAGSLTASNSFNLGQTSGVSLTITPPSAGGGGGFIINGSIEPGDIFPDNENLAISKVASR